MPVLEISLALLAFCCALRSVLMFERARWVRFVRGCSRECRTDAQFHNEVLAASYTVDLRGWS